MATIVSCIRPVIGKMTVVGEKGTLLKTFTFLSGIVVGKNREGVKETLGSNLYGLLPK